MSSQVTKEKPSKRSPPTTFGFTTEWRHQAVAAMTLTGYVAPLALAPLLFSRVQTPWLTYMFALTLVWLLLDTIPVPLVSLLPLFTVPAWDEYMPDYMFTESSLMNLVACSILVSAAEQTNLFGRAALCLLATFGYRTRALLGVFSLCAICVTHLTTKAPATLFLCALVDAAMFEIQNEAIANAFPWAVEGRRAKQVLTAVGIGEEQGATVVSVLQMTPYTWTPSTDSSRLKLSPSSQLSTESSYSRLDAIRIEVEGAARAAPLARSILKFDNNQVLAVRRMKQFAGIRKALLLSTAYCCILGSIGNVTGDVAFLPLQAFFQKKYGYKGISVVTWVMVGMPAAVMSASFVTIIMFYKYLHLHDFKEESTIHTKIQGFINRKRGLIGKRRGTEVTFTFVYAVLCVVWKIQKVAAIFPWMERSLHIKYLDEATPSFVVILLITAFSRTSHDTIPLCSQCEVGRKQWCRCAVPWRAVLALLGGLALARLARTAGIVGVMLQAVRKRLSGLPPLQTQIALTVTSSLFAELRVAGLISVAAELGDQGKVHPLYYAFPVALARSTASMLPSATPVIAIVQSLADIRCSELVATGLLAKLLATVAITISVNVVGSELFRLDTFPVCANCSNATYNF